MTVMLYKAPGKRKLHGVMVDYCVVSEGDAEAALEDGWHKTPLDAHEAMLGEQVAELAEDKPKPRCGRPPKKAKDE